MALTAKNITPTEVETGLIVVVEADKERGERLIHLIEDEASYLATLVPDCQQALEVIDYIQPDLVLVDDQQPKVSSRRLLKAISAKKHLMHVPILILNIANIFT